MLTPSMLNPSHPPPHPQNRYVRIKRKQQTIFLHVEQTETVQGVKAQLGEIVGQSPADIRLFGSDKVRVRVGRGGRQGRKGKGLLIQCCVHVRQIFIATASMIAHHFPLISNSYRQGICRTRPCCRSSRTSRAIPFCTWSSGMPVSNREGGMVRRERL